jgi:hypothetical protein
MEPLDRHLDGGIPRGTLVALVAPPTSQSELFLQSMGRTRPVTHVSTTCRNPRESEQRFGGPAGGNSEVNHVHADPEALLGGDELPFDVGSESFVLVDPVDELERQSRDGYLGFLEALSEALVETDSVGVLHALDVPDRPDHRWLSLKRADHVWQLELTPTSQDIRNRLLVTKSRGYRALTEPIPLVLTDRVRIDTSRSIG